MPTGWPSSSSYDPQMCVQKTTGRVSSTSRFRTANLMHTRAVAFLLRGWGEKRGGFTYKSSSFYRIGRGVTATLSVNAGWQMLRGRQSGTLWGSDSGGGRGPKPPRGGDASPNRPPNRSDSAIMIIIIIIVYRLLLL